MPALRITAAELGLDFVSVAAAPDVPRHAAKVPRIGVWVPWADTDSIGWIRYSLDQRKIPYTYLRDEDIRAGMLRDHIDVLFTVTSISNSPNRFKACPRRWGPMPFKKTPQTPSFGTPAESDDITGGIGWEGLAKLQSFVEDGGLLVTLGSGSMLALEGGIVRGVRRVSGGVPRSTPGGGSDSAAAAQEAATRTPGRTHARHLSLAPTIRSPTAIPCALTSSARIFRSTMLRAAGCAWPTAPLASMGPPIAAASSSNGVIAKARRCSSAVKSGATPDLIGRPAILDMPAGHGHVVTFNFNPIHRDLNRGDQRLVWNAIINWQAIVAGHPKTSNRSQLAPEE